MELNKTTTHAVRLLIQCAQLEDEIVKVAQLAEQLDLSTQNAFKIVHLLSRAGFVAPVRGRNGGVRLARPANEIGVGEVVLAMEYPAIEAQAGGSTKRSSDRPVVPLVEEAFRAFIEVLNQNTIADVARGNAKPKAQPKKPTAKSQSGRKAKPTRARNLRASAAAKRSSPRPN